MSDKLKISFLATTTGTRPDLFENLLASFNALEIPPGWAAELVALDQAPALHHEIFERNAAAQGRTVVRITTASTIPLSIARNRLLASLAGQGYVVFCDDDASYPVDFLASLRSEFASHGAPDIGIFRLLNKGDTTAYGNRQYPERSGPLSRHAMINLAISLNLVMKLECIVRLGGFNEQLGVGSKGLCGEETELVLRAIDSGARGAFLGSPFAFHPRQELVAMDMAKVYNYSRGYRDMLLGYRGSPGLCLIIRAHLYLTIARSALGFVLRKQERAGRLIKLKGLLGRPLARGAA